MNTLLQSHNCQWPTLASPYHEALQAAVEYILARFPVLGIIASGSIIRGNPGPTSDFDICVIHDQPQRQRLQRRFHGVPAEIFVNPPHTIRGYFANEHGEGRPSTAHMFATGFPILVNAPVVTELQEEARTWLQKAPTITEQKLLSLRYGIVDQLDNAKDLLDSDPECAARILHQAVDQLVDYCFLSNGRFLPRLKESIARLAEIDPELGQLTRAYYQTSNVQTQTQLADALAHRILDVTEFFEWESELQTV
jgi:Nucleotidyltransferase domain